MILPIPVVKLRGGAGGSAPCSDLSPLQWYESILIESIKCYFMLK